MEYKEIMDLNYGPGLTDGETAWKAQRDTTTRWPVEERVAGSPLDEEDARLEADYGVEGGEYPGDLLVLGENIAGPLTDEELRLAMGQSRLLRRTLIDDDDGGQTGDIPVITAPIAVERNVIVAEAPSITRRLKKIARGVGTGFLLLFNTNEADF